MIARGRYGPLGGEPAPRHPSGRIRVARTSEDVAAVGGVARHQRYGISAGCVVPVTRGVGWGSSCGQVVRAGPAGVRLLAQRLLPSFSDNRGAKGASVSRSLEGTLSTRLPVIQGGRRAVRLSQARALVWSQRQAVYECDLSEAGPPAGHLAAPGYPGVKAGPPSARATSYAGALGLSEGTSARATVCAWAFGVCGFCGDDASDRDQGARESDSR